MSPIVTGRTEGPTAAVGRAPGAGFILQVIGDGFVERHALPERGQVVLGRSAAVDIQIDDASISRRHAALYFGADIELEDLGSVNGTRARNESLAAGRTIVVRPNEVIELGGVIVIVQPATSEGARATGRQACTVAAPHPNASETGLSPAMRSLHRLADRIAPSDLAVLVLGETGAGKEVVAQRVHARSSRRDRPFVAVNCAAIAESLLESELFGHEKGAFTGAESARPGLLESADGGTVFLDEIGELPLSLQAKLLRTVETREVTRIGARKPRTLDVRFIAATHRNLGEEVASGRFRQDLYFRLDGISLTVPPLRERRDELGMLARGFLRHAVARANRAHAPELEDSALSLLSAYGWPGNVRELRNVIERAVLLCEGNVIDSACVGALLPNAASSATAEPALEAEAQLERDRIVEALALSDGNQTQAAKRLGISRATLLMRLDAYRIARPRKRSPFG